MKLINDWSTLVALRMVTSFLSLIGCLFAIFSMWYFKKLKALSTRLILMLTISALGESIFNLLTLAVYEREEERFGLCFFQGVGLQITQIAEFLWTVVISFNLYMVVVKHKTHLETFEKVYHAIVWGIVVVLTILPMFTGSYGPAGVWCWIQKTGIANVWRFVTFYVPLYLCIIIMLVMYAIIIRTVRKVMQGQTEVSEEAQRRAQNAMDRLRAYPIIFVLLYIMPTINRVANWITNDEVYFLYLAHVLTAPLLGFVNAIVYGLDDDIRKRYKLICIKKGWCTCCCDPNTANLQESEEDEDTDEFVGDDELGITGHSSAPARPNMEDTIF